MHSRSKGVTVTGTGEATSPPDLITVNIGVTALAPTVAEASGIAAGAAENLLAVLADAGLDLADIGTTNYSIASEHDWSNNVRRLLGYRVNNTLNVRIRDLERAGDILDQAVEAAGDAVTVNNLQFSIEDPTDLERRARDAAWTDAKAIADQLANLAGRQLGRATSIVETQGGAIPFPTPRRREMAMTSDASTPIEGGTTTITVSISVRFEFDD